MEGNSKEKDFFISIKRKTMMLVTGHSLTLLKFLCASIDMISEQKLKTYSFSSRGNLDHYLESKKFLTEMNFIESSNDGYAITAEGKEYMQDFNDFCLKEVFNGDYDYAILKFLYAIEKPVSIDCFPDSILSHAPQDGKGMGKEYLLQTHLAFRSSLKRYVNNKNAEYSINEMGIKYFEHLQSENRKQIEISNKPLVHIDSSTNFHGNHNVNAPGSEINESFKVTEDSESKLVSKQSLQTGKATLYWTISLAIITIIISILIARHII